MRPKTTILILALTLLSCESKNYKFTYTRSRKLVKDIETKKVVVSKVTFETHLTQIAKNDKDPEVRKMAAKRLNQLK
jgi:hypothetical protein|tara:strand:+ start:780 stop:1010 length:231 start_codon:yes stop_codon:yes gene_type:complete